MRGIKTAKFVVCLSALCLLAFYSFMSFSTTHAAAPSAFDDLSLIYDIPPAALSLIKDEIEADWAARDHSVIDANLEAEGVFTDCQFRFMTTDCCYFWS